MSNVVKFLEALGQNIEAVSKEQLDQFIFDANLDMANKERLASQSDMEKVSQVAIKCCVLFPADNDEPKEGEDEHHEDEKDTPDRENSSIAA